MWEEIFVWEEIFSGRKFSVGGNFQWEEIFVQTVLNDTHQVLLLIMWVEIFVWEEIFNERNFLSTPSFMTLTRFDF